MSQKNTSFPRFPLSAEAARANKKLDFDGKPFTSFVHFGGFIWLQSTIARDLKTLPRPSNVHLHFPFEKFGFEALVKPLPPAPPGYQPPVPFEVLAENLRHDLIFFGTPQAIMNTFLPSDLLSMVEEAGVRLAGSVHLQAGWEQGPLGEVGETKWLQEEVNAPSKGQVATGIVGMVDLLNNTPETVRAQLKAHFQYSAFRGIRYILAHPRAGMNDFTFNPRDNLVDDPTFLKNFAVLEEFGAEFDLYCYGHQLHQAIKLAKKFPNIRMALNHFGTPIDVANDKKVYNKWVEDMRELSKCPNVYCKLSGLMVPLGFREFLYKKPWNTAGPTAREIADSVYGDMIKTTVKLFGVERCFFGSNFLVDWASARYGELLASYVLSLEDMGVTSKADLRKIFRENCARFYKLTLTDEAKL
ncbi:hypothetical protein SmJEL517_g00340 [Synchytrium microbalum]|uniref:Amidohydrolase-related domain-containing protein n=1 Tax=Synchytrium microbalum TaxID=1806994 RepID=A0A507CKJ2_9FUNG|nr:uncharacterized protein SmJEL517_g00340 [Synchytrium microbalum]TPX38353.1 hypothetical protein SmJEL517_g00340 [Synchytrium microbalum]